MIDADSSILIVIRNRRARRSRLNFFHLGIIECGLYHELCAWSALCQLRKAGYTPVETCDDRGASRTLQADYDFKGSIFDMMMPHLEGIDVMITGSSSATGSETTFE
jgi:hypothetical protein